MGGLSHHSETTLLKNYEIGLARKATGSLVSHIKGETNYQADLASRLFNDRTEWTLPQQAIVRIVEIFGCPTIDLFATMLNHRTKRYVSWSPDPKCTEVFSISWADEFPYLFLPFNVIYRCLQIIEYQS